MANYACKSYKHKETDNEIKNSEDKRKTMYCPICNKEIIQSDYLEGIFNDDYPTLWIANLVTHYRHYHITSWNKCWDKYGNRYRGSWFGDYDEEKAKVNERAKRQLIRKSYQSLNANGVTVETFLKLQNTTEETIKVAKKYLNSCTENV